MVGVGAWYAVRVGVEVRCGRLGLMPRGVVHADVDVDLVRVRVRVRDLGSVVSGQGQGQG